MFASTRPGATTKITVRSAAFVDTNAAAATDGRFSTTDLPQIALPRILAAFLHFLFFDVAIRELLVDESPREEFCALTEAFILSETAERR